MKNTIRCLISGGLLAALAGSAQAQQVDLMRTLSLPDSTHARRSVVVNPTRPAAQVVRWGVLVPAALLAAGALTTHRVELLESDEEMREESREHLRWVHTSADDQLRHVPAYATLGLSLLGVKGRHTTSEQVVLFALTYTINNTLTSNLKRLTHVERPQGNSFDSFPSQHTSAAFSAARLLDKEYGDQSIWYSAGGYAVATGVAGLRVAKDNHWLSDVLAGAGVGMLSTELAYRVYPLVRRTVNRVLPAGRGLGERMAVLPLYQQGAVGATVVWAVR